MTQEIVLEKLEDLLAERVRDLSDEARFVGDEPTVDLEDVDAAIVDIGAALDERLNHDSGSGDDDQFEGEMAGLLYAALDRIDVTTLDDPGFWAYLATGPLWFFVKWREDPDRRSHASYSVYVDGKSSECVPLRMFLRAQAIAHDGDTTLAASIEKGVDFWRSHIIRVRTGSHPSLARAVVEEHKRKRMTVNPLREYAKRVNRRWSNEVMYLLDEHECDEVAHEERNDLF